MEQDWIMGLLGGGMIGLAATGFLLLNGKIMGASGLLGGLLDRSGGETTERLAFLIGLIGFPAILMMFRDLPATNATQNFGLLIVAGLCVGIGTRLANGCTSGHGVCGMSRFSLRSILATGIYIGAGVMTVTALRLWGAV